MGRKPAVKSESVTQNWAQPQRDRLAFIELRLRFMGEVQRQDLVDRFGVQTAAATRDFSIYKEMASDNLFYDAKGKTYRIGEKFKPFFEFPLERIMALLSHGFGDGEPVPRGSWIHTDSPFRLHQPDLDVLAVVTRAIHQKRPLDMEYHSLSSGAGKRVILPYALVDTGLRWHVRAFDRKSKEFRDFVISRIKNPQLMPYETMAEGEQSQSDIQWTRIVELELVPHPDRPHPEITEMDYGMAHGCLRLRLRAATVGYTLRKWNVDCSSQHVLSGEEYRLWLRDPLVLYGVHNAAIAPGYHPPVLT